MSLSKPSWGPSNPFERTDSTDSSWSGEADETLRFVRVPAKKRLTIDYSHRTMAAAERILDRRGKPWWRRAVDRIGQVFRLRRAKRPT